MNTEAIERKSDTRKKSGFEKWLDEPMVRMGMSLIPAGDHADALRMLLQSSFEAGFNCGAGDMVGKLVESLITKKKPDDI